ncbi:MAG: prolyl oligopeptidase family serine peptidase [Labilithrix sp.]|nr:prolyl oligopeptidase family serine peptidase [Labilithrix sp.]
MRGGRSWMLALLLFAFACVRPSTVTPRDAAANATNERAMRGALLEARRGFATKFIDEDPRSVAAASPPSDVFERVHYPSPVGPLAAYITPRRGEAKRRPAIVWIVGGFDNSIGDDAWEPAPEEDDQSARAFREAGFVLMLPSLRGGNDNPGRREMLFGEVDDVLAARDWLSARAAHYGVDPERIYLGGHSTGGTLALLVAAGTDRFRAVFSLGPVADVRTYFPDLELWGIPGEARLRSPIEFVSSIRTPTLIIEGEDSPIADDVTLLGGARKSAPIQTLLVEGRNHFDVIVPVTRALARKMRDDDGPTSRIELRASDLSSAR